MKRLLPVLMGFALSRRVMREAQMGSPKWLVIVALLVMAGCQSVDYVGSGPLYLSPKIQAHFEKYKSNPTTLKYYIVSTDGRSFLGYFCPDYSGCEMAPGDAIGQCEMHYGKPCKLYAEGNDIVWRFDGPKTVPGTAVTSQSGPRRYTWKVNIRSHSDKNVCTLALQLNRPIWENSENYSLDVFEAKRRGLTEQQCARLAGRFLDPRGIKIAKAAGAINVPGTAVAAKKSPASDVSSPDILKANIAILRRTNACIGCDLRRAELRYAKLQNADLRGANLQNADLMGAYLKGAYLKGAYLKGAILLSANLPGADLRDANLQGAKLQNADLRDANLQGAKLQNADLKWANLPSADLLAANLKNADLKWANLEDAKLENVGLKIARASGAINVPGTAVTTEKSPSKITKKATTSDIETRLLKLQGLLKKGLITKEDAARKRKELLEKL